MLPVTSALEADGLRLAGERRQQRVTLEHELIRIAEHRELVEVVHHQHRVEAGGVGFLRLVGNSVEEIGGADAGIREVGDLVAETGHGPI